MPTSFSERGYIALTTTLILGLVIFLLATSVALSTFFSRRGGVDVILKERANFMARSCLEQALVKLASSSSYAGNQTITIDGTDTCQIQTITSNPPNKTIKTTSTILNNTASYELIIDSATLKTVNFKEE